MHTNFLKEICWTDLCRIHHSYQFTNDRSVISLLSVYKWSISYQFVISLQMINQLSVYKSNDVRKCCQNLYTQRRKVVQYVLHSVGENNSYWYSAACGSHTITDICIYPIHKYCMHDPYTHTVTTHMSCSLELSIFSSFCTATLTP